MRDSHLNISRLAEQAFRTTGDALASTAAITAVDLCSERVESAIETPVVFIVDQGDALGGMQHSRSEGYFFYPLS